MADRVTAPVVWQGSPPHAYSPKTTGGSRRRNSKCSMAYTLIGPEATTGIPENACKLCLLKLGWRKAAGKVVVRLRSRSRPSASRERPEAP